MNPPHLDPPRFHDSTTRPGYRILLRHRCGHRGGAVTAAAQTRQLRGGRCSQQSEDCGARARVSSVDQAGGSVEAQIERRVADLPVVGLAKIEQHASARSVDKARARMRGRHLLHSNTIA